METITWIFVGIAIFFFIILTIKNIFNLKKTCAICLSVTLTWIILLILYSLNLFLDKIIIALLMGHTSLGLFYLWEKRAKEKFKVFRLPLLLTFIFIIYSVLEGFGFNNLIFITALWLFFLIIYLLRSKKSVGKFFNKILECCKRW